MKIKVGDKVQIKKDLTYEETHITNIGEYVGKVATVTELNGSIYIDLDNKRWCWRKSWFEPITKTLDNLEVGDVLLTNDGYEVTVLDVSKSNKWVYLNTYAWWAVINLKTLGYTLIKEELEPKVKKAIKLLEEKGYKVEK